MLLLGPLTILPLGRIRLRRTNTFCLCRSNGAHTTRIPEYHGNEWANPFELGRSISLIIDLIIADWRGALVGYQILEELDTASQRYNSSLTTTADLLRS